MISPGRILIIDDNRDLADGLAAILEDTGYSATTAYTGLSGIEAFTKTVFDLVFLDVKLPDMDGLEVLRHLRHVQPNCSRILMSGHLNVKITLDAIMNTMQVTTAVRAGIAREHEQAATVAVCRGADCERVPVQEHVPTERRCGLGQRCARAGPRLQPRPCRGGEWRGRRLPVPDLPGPMLKDSFRSGAESCSRLLARVSSSNPE